MNEKKLTFQQIRFVLEGAVNELWESGKSDKEKIYNIKRNLTVLCKQIQRSE